MTVLVLMQGRKFVQCHNAIDNTRFKHTVPSQRYAPKQHLRTSMKRLRNNERRTPSKCHVTQIDTRQASEVDVHSPYTLQEDQIRCYREAGFVRLPNVFDAGTLAHYTPTMSLEVANADKTPLEEDSDYQKAFTQVSASVLSF